jgi:hypothetical protein
MAWLDVVKGSGPVVARGLRKAFDLRRERDIPTVSIYFSSAMRSFIGDRLGADTKPIRRVSPTVFVCGNAAVVVRYAAPETLNFLERRRFDRLYYVIDDNLHCLGEGDGLPADYRRRLLVHRERVLPRILSIATHVVSPAEEVLRHFPDKICLKLDPAQCHEVASLEHFDRDMPVSMVFAASRSHLSDLEMIEPALVALLHKNPLLNLTMFMGQHAPGSLQRLSNVRNFAPMPWDAYRQFVRSNRFHIGIAPSRDTAFNQSRSISRFHDHAAYGATGVYSNQAPFSTLVAHEKTGILVNNDPGSWYGTLSDLVRRVNDVRHIAHEAAMTSLLLGDSSRTAMFWRQQLSIPA